MGKGLKIRMFFLFQRKNVFRMKIRDVNTFWGWNGMEMEKGVGMEHICGFYRTSKVFQRKFAVYVD